MSITDLLNSGELHTSARQRRPNSVDSNGNIHASPERADFVNWRTEMAAAHGQDASQWPADARAEYQARYVPSH